MLTIHIDGQSIATRIFLSRAELFPYVIFFEVDYIHLDQSMDGGEYGYTHPHHTSDCMHITSSSGLSGDDMVDVDFRSHYRWYT